MADFFYFDPDPMEALFPLVAIPIDGLKMSPRRILNYVEEVIPTYLSFQAHFRMGWETFQARCNTFVSDVIYDVHTTLE